MSLSRFFFFLGLLLIAVGFCLHYKVAFPKIFSWIGHLPGDVILHKGNWVVYFPITTSIVISLILSFILGLFFRK